MEARWRDTPGGFELSDELADELAVTEDIAVVRKALETVRPGLRLAATRAALRLSWWEGLRKALRDEDGTVSREALRSLLTAWELNRQPEFVPSMMTALLASRESSTRELACKVLGACGRRSAVPLLLDHLPGHEEDGPHVARALAALEAVEVIDLLDEIDDLPAAEKKRIREDIRSLDGFDEAYRVSKIKKARQLKREGNLKKALTIYRDEGLLERAGDTDLDYDSL